MTGKSRNPLHLWEELKQRKVVRVITVYTASAFALLQGTDMVFSRLGLPAWTISVLMILLAIGLVIAVVLSWIYDITPEGIKKTQGNVQPRNDFIGQGGEAVSISGNRPIRTEDNFHSEKFLYDEKIRKYKKKEKIYSFSSLTVILLVIILFMFSSGSLIPFTKHDWVVISDFENLTKEPVFDKSLYTAFTLTINQSRHLNVFPKSRMIETLQRMKTAYQGFINEQTGKEIAVREGINLLIAPSISQIGNRFVITSEIIESRTGNLIKSIVLYASNPDDILRTLDRLSRSVRRELGESRFHIVMQDKPLSKVTTSSLPALKQFSLGIESHYRLDFAAAKNYYESALRIDTGFVAAKASLGNLNYERFDTTLGKKLLREAVRSVDNLTDKEKFGILAFYAVNVEHNLNKGIENEKILTGLYPDDPAYHNNLGWYYQKANRYNEAASEYKAAVRINPSMALTYGGLLWVYLEKLGKVDSALVWSRKMIADNPQNAWGYFYLGSAYVCLDSLEKGASSFQRASDINPGFIMNMYRLAHTYHLMSRYRDAIRVLEKIPQLSNDELSAYYDIGVNYLGLDDRNEAGRYFRLFQEKASVRWMKEYPDLAETYISLGVVSARLKDNVTSEQFLKKALSLDSTVYDRYAEIYNQQGKIPQAIDQIQKALESGYRDLYWLKSNPDLLPLQREPHFRELLKKYF